jgi:hypothetical protein
MLWWHGENVEFGIERQDNYSSTACYPVRVCAWCAIIMKVRFKMEVILLPITSAKTVLK